VVAIGVSAVGLTPTSIAPVPLAAAKTYLLALTRSVVSTHYPSPAGDQSTIAPVRGEVPPALPTAVTPARRLYPRST